MERANGVVITNEGFGGSPLGVRVKKQTPGVGAEFNYDYDWDNCQTAVNRGDREWKYYFDKDTGLLDTKVDPAGYEWTYTYDLIFRTNENPIDLRYNIIPDIEISPTL